MKRALLFALSLIPAFCLAEKQTELSEESTKQLADLVSANDYLAVVEINKGTFTGACMVHDKVKVVAQLKGKLGTTSLFSSINADKNALTLPPEHQDRADSYPGTYLVIVKAREIVIQRSVNKPSFNYFIQHYEWAHCAWAVDSMEANYFGNLPKTISRQTNRKHPPPTLVQ